MSGNVFRAAENHYGGDMFIIGFNNGRDKVPDTLPLMRTLDDAGFTYRKALFRTMINAEGVLYFSGFAVKQKYVFGIDWENEQSEFAALDFSEGGADFPSLDNGIFVSAAVAKELGARAGDDLDLEVTTTYGQKNTGKFVIKGIIRDNSIFGYYKCFISRSRLNQLIGYAPDECSWIGFLFDNKDPGYILEQAARVHTILARDFPVGPLVDTREAFQSEMSGSDAYPGFHYTIMTLNAYISQVGDLLSAMQLLAYFLYIMMIIITLSSITVTYRLILHERAREIGTVRVMGSTSFSTQVILVVEYLCLLILSIFLGFVLALLLNYLLSLFSYDWIPGFEIFLHKGRLTAAFPARLIVTNILIMVATTLPAVWIPAFRISRTELTKILVGGSR